MNLELIFSIIAVGIGATIVMDIWALFLKRVLNIPSLNYCFVGRWVGHMSSGTFTHNNISQAGTKAFECSIGWSVHYGVGIVFSMILVAGLSPSWLENPTILPALIFGLATVAVPFFIMQPSLGLGIAASKTPNPNQARLRSLMAHGSFGVGLYLTAWLLS